MRIFTALAGWLFSKTEPQDGMRLEEYSYWIIDPIQDGAKFFRSLIDFVPDGAIVCLEGPTESRIPDTLAQRHAENPAKVAAGTLWPKSDFIHIDASYQNLEDLSSNIEKYQIAMPAIHTHVYKDNQMLIEWFDAFTDEPIRVSISINEADVRLLAERLNSNYRLSD